MVLSSQSVQYFMIWPGCYIFNLQRAWGKSNLMGFLLIPYETSIHREMEPFEKVGTPEEIFIQLCLRATIFMAH